MKNRKGEVVTLLTIGALVVIGVTAVITSLSPTQNQKKTTSSRAASACMDTEIKCDSATNNDCCDASTQKCSAGKCVPLSSTDCGGPESCSENSNQYYKKSGVYYSDKLCSTSKKIDSLTTYCAPPVTACEGPKTCATSTNKYYVKSGVYYKTAGCPSGTATSLTTVCPPPTSIPQPDPTVPDTATCTTGQKFVGTNGYNVDTAGNICIANGGTYVGSNQQGTENGQRWACCKLSDTTLGFDGCCKAYRPDMYNCPGGNKVVIYARSMSAVGMTSCSKYNSSTNTSMYFACDPNKYVDGGCTSSIIWDGGMSVDDKNNQGKLVNATPTPEPQMGECEFVACGDDTEKGYYKRVRTGGSVGYYRDGDKCEADSGLSESSIKRDVCGGGTAGQCYSKSLITCPGKTTKVSYYKSKTTPKCNGTEIDDTCYGTTSDSCELYTWKQIIANGCNGTELPPVDGEEPGGGVIIGEGTVQTDAATGIIANAAQLNGSYKGTFQAVGFTLNEKKYAVKVASPFSYFITDLKPDTIYTYNTYGSIDGKNVIGTSTTFKTLKTENSTANRCKSNLKCGTTVPQSCGTTVLYDFPSAFTTSCYGYVWGVNWTGQRSYHVTGKDEEGNCIISCTKDGDPAGTYNGVCDDSSTCIEERTWGPKLAFTVISSYAQSCFDKNIKIVGIGVSGTTTKDTTGKTINNSTRNITENFEVIPKEKKETYTFRGWINQSDKDGVVSTMYSKEIVMSGVAPQPATFEVVVNCN